MSQLTPLVILDNRPLVADLLERALRTSCPQRFEVIGRATGSKDVTRLLGGPSARVLILQDQAPDWIRMIRRFRHAWPRCSVLIVTEQAELDIVGVAAWAGAHGLVTSAMGADVLLDAIESLAAGHGTFSARANRYFHSYKLACDAAIANEEPMPVLRESLQPAERNALVAYAESGTITDAATSLGKSRLTIRNNVDRAREKLGAANRVQAIWFAIRVGAIEVQLDVPTVAKAKAA